MQRRRNAGFTLVEVIVAVVILGTGVAMMAQGVTAAIRANARVQRITRASMAADEIFQRMEIGEIDVQTQNEGTLEDVGLPVGSGGAGEAEEDYRTVFRWESEVQTWTEEDLYLVILTVYWNLYGRDTEEKSFEAHRLFYLPGEEEEE